METSRPLVPLPGADLQQRAGDADRTAVCEQLAAHYAVGRLREDELDARLGAAVDAVTLRELRRLVSDLPPTAAPPAPAASVPWSALDLLALLTVVGSLGFAVLMAVLVAAAAPGVFLLACFFGGCVAAAGARRRSTSRTAPGSGRRPGLSGPASPDGSP